MTGELIMRESSGTQAHLSFARAKVPCRMRPIVFASHIMVVPPGHATRWALASANFGVWGAQAAASSAHDNAVETDRKILNS
jgi:hypothetical protein